MVRPKKSRERASQVEAKKGTIKDFTDWLLGLKNPQFMKKALSNAVEAGGWKADPGNDKNMMRRYLLSIEDDTIETEVRRTQARKLRDQLDEDTVLNAVKRLQVATRIRRPLTVEIDCLGGKKNRVVTIVRGSKATLNGTKGALNRRASVSASIGLDEQGPPRCGGHNHLYPVVCSNLAEGAKASSSIDSKEQSFSDDHLEVLPFEVRTVGDNETGGVSGDQHEGHRFIAESRSASGPLASNFEPDLDIDSTWSPPPSAGASSPPSSLKQATRTTPRQILGDITPNVNLKQALLSKQGPQSVKSGLSTETWPVKEQHDESSELAQDEPGSQSGLGESGRAPEVAEGGHGLVAGADPGPGMTSADARRLNGLQAGPDPSSFVGNRGNWTEEYGWYHAPGKNVSDLNGAVWGYSQPGCDSGGGFGAHHGRAFHEFDQRAETKSYSSATRSLHPGPSQDNSVSCPPASLPRLQSRPHHMDWPGEHVGAPREGGVKNHRSAPPTSSLIKAPFVKSRAAASAPGARDKHA